MTVYTKRAVDVFAPATAAGAARGADMGEAMVWGTEVERASDGAAAGRVDQSTWAGLAAITGTRAGQPAIVFGPDAGTHTDPVAGGTVANVGEYYWSASPVGWRRAGTLQRTLVHALNTGAGTANAVQAISDVQFSTTAYAALITVNFGASNSGAMTLAINGETPRPLVTNTGEPVPAGYVTAGMSALVQIDGAGNYRLFSYGDATAIQAAAEAAQAAAEAARDAALAAMPNSFPATRTALKVIPTGTTTSAYLKEAGREGQFVWKTGDYSAQIAADPLEGLYVKADGVPATSGAWVRVVQNRTVFPEFWGGEAISDGTTDATAAWQAALASGYHINGKQNAVYYTTATLGSPSSNTMIHFHGSKIIADWEQAGTVFEAVFFMIGKDKVRIRGGEIEYAGTFDFGTSYGGFVSGIHANECDHLTVIDMEVHGFNRAGILVGAKADGSVIEYSESPKVIRCHAHHNRVGGVMYGQTNNGLVDGCDLHWNGAVTDTGTGYGFAGWSSYIAKNTTVVNNHSDDNYRKAIDFHNGENGIVSNNSCMRNRVFGMYIEGVRGSWVITNNIIKDMLWDNSVPGIGTMYGIAVGHAAGQGTNGIPTSFHIAGNKIVNFTKTAGEAVGIFMWGHGLSNGKINIVNNEFDLGVVTNVVIGTNAATSAGNYHDVNIDGNDVRVTECTGAPFFVRGSTNRKKSFCNNRVTVGTADSAVGVYTYDTTSVTGRSLIANDNDITAPASAWSSGYDAIFIKRVAEERMEGNVVNGASWRDWDGARFIGRGTGGNPPSDGKYWTAGSIWWTINVAAGGNPGSICVTAGSIGTWKFMPIIAA